MTVPTDANPPILDRHVAGCFYCGRFGPYTAEHVVSAGLGGDDPAWMLRECVCTFCNNQTFSRMETHVFKASYIALMRLFSQPTTRDGTPPAPLQAPTTVQLGDDGPHAAGDFGAGGQAGVFAQILFETTDAGDISFPLIGPDRPSVNALLAALRERLHDEVVVIEKHHARSFTTTTLTWTSDRYQAGASVPVQKPPAAGIWFEPEYVPATADAPPPWTVFRRPTGQLIGRAPDLAHLTGLLSELRPYLDEIVRAFGNASIESSNAQPGVHIGMTTELHTVERCASRSG